jgi:hypothetical protein
VLTWILPWRAAADPEPPPAGPEDEPALAAAANRGER